MIWFLLPWVWAAPTFATPSEELESDEIVSQVMAHEEELMTAVRIHDPEHFERLLRLREIDRPAYVIALVRIAKTVQRAREDPEIAERMLKIKARSRELRELATAYEELTKPEQREARKEMERVTGELMDLKQADRRARLEQLRGRLEELQAEIDGREQDRESIISDYVDQLLTEPVDL